METRATVTEEIRTDIDSITAIVDGLKDHYTPTTKFVDSFSALRKVKIDTEITHSKLNMLKNIICGRRCNTIPEAH